MNFYGNQFNPQMTPMQNPYLQTRQNVNEPVNTINWVQGIEGAKACQLPPNSNTILMDSENNGIFYIKISDNIGICTLRKFKYEEITDTVNTARSVDLSEYVKKSELATLINSMLGGNKNEQLVSGNDGTTITSNA